MNRSVLITKKFPNGVATFRHIRTFHLIFRNQVQDQIAVRSITNNSFLVAVI